jgi:glucosamine-6-phosphate deaminase
MCINYYIKGFNLDIKRALLINSDEIALPDGRHYSEVFPDSRIDLTLRHREAVNSFEKLQQRNRSSALITGAPILKTR